MSQLARHHLGIRIAHLPHHIVLATTARFLCDGTAMMQWLDRSESEKDPAGPREYRNGSLDLGKLGACGRTRGAEIIEPIKKLAGAISDDEDGIPHKKHRENAIISECAKHRTHQFV